MPATANLVQDGLGISAPAMDLQAACASFIYAMLSGMQFIATGCCRHVLAVGADVNSRVVNPADKKTYPLFGDAAGAVVLAAGSPEQGILAYAAGSDGSGRRCCCRPMGGTRMPFCADAHLDGATTSRWTARRCSSGPSACSRRRPTKCWPPPA